MRTLVTIFILVASVFAGRAQTAPTLGFRKLATGEIELSWRLEMAYPGAADMLPRYSIETGTAIGEWQPTGVILPGESFTNITATTVWPGLSNQPIAFLRLEKQLNFSGRDLIGRSFTNAVFSSADFSGADLLLANLTDASLQNAFFRGTDLRQAKLNGVNARGANFILARMARVDLTGADLRGADLRFVEFTDANLSFAQLDDADLRGAILEGVTNFFTRFHGCATDSLTVMDPEIRAIWEIVNNKGAGKNFNALDLSLADLSGGNLTNAQLQATDLSGVDFQMCDLSGANLTGATLRFLDLRGTKITAQTIIASKWRTIWDIINNPKTNRVHLNADFTLSLFVDTVFDHADLRGARFTSGSIFGGTFHTANMQSANLSGTSVFDADFRNANLSNANLSNASFDGVDLTGATLAGANSLGTKFTNTIMPDGTPSK